MKLRPFTYDLSMQLEPKHWIFDFQQISKSSGTRFCFTTSRLSVTSAEFDQQLRRSRMATKLGRVALRCLKAPSFAPAAPARPISTSFVGFLTLV